MSLRGLLDLDQSLTRRLRLDDQRGPLFRLAAVVAHSADSWFWLAGLAGLWLFGGAAWRGRAAVMILGMVFLAVMVLGVKFTIRRRRPEGEWGAIYRSTDPHSFPSGHASRAFMLAVLAAGTGPVWLALALAVWAPLVAAARVITGVHYLSDVVAGLIIGLVMGAVFLEGLPVAAAALPFLF